MATSADRFIHRPNAIDRLGKTVVYAGELLRHPVYTRFLHWMVGIFFFLALLSGFGIYLPWIFRFFTPLFGGGAMTRLLHPWFGLGICFLLRTASNQLAGRDAVDAGGFALDEAHQGIRDSQRFDGIAGDRLLQRRPEDDVLGNRLRLHRLPHYRRHDVVPAPVRSNPGFHRLRDSRHLGADHAVWNLLSHLPQHISASLEPSRR